MQTCESDTRHAHSNDNASDTAAVRLVGHRRQTRLKETERGSLQTVLFYFEPVLSVARVLTREMRSRDPLPKENKLVRDLSASFRSTGFIGRQAPKESGTAQPMLSSCWRVSLSMLTKHANTGC